MKRSPVLLAPLVLVFLLLALTAGPARAAGCTDNWTGSVSSDWFTAGNWDNGIPTSASDVCINNNSTVTVVISGIVTAEANSVQLGVGSSSGTQTLQIEGVDNGVNGQQAELDLQNGGTIGPTGDLKLTDACTGSPCTHGPPASLTNLGSTALINNGAIESNHGDEGAGRSIFGNAVNNGTILVDSPLTWSGGAVDNHGTISMASAQVFTIGCCANTASVTNDTNGLITNNAGSGQMLLTAKATFIQGAGTTSPSSVNPTDPAVVLFDDTFSASPTLSYTGTGASAIEARGSVNMTGSLASGQNLTINGVVGCPSTQSAVTAVSGFTNAGTITLAGTCDSGLKLTSGTLTNTGTLTAASTPSGRSREIKGSLSNSGTFHVNGDTVFDGSGATLTQTAGTTVLSGKTLDISGSAATFQLQGGLLQGTGTSVLNGSLANTGGSLLVGSGSAPGHMSVDSNYSQGSGGKLTVVLDGTTVGTGYSQLSVAGSSTLGGKLTITTLSGPTAGDIYTILGGGPVSGKFAQIAGQFVPNATSATSGYLLDYRSSTLSLDAEAVFGLLVKKAGVGTGTVTSSPAGINCGSSCQKSFFQTQTVTLTEHPGSGWAFGGWSGGCTGFATTCKVKMNQARTVTAKFARGTTTSLSASRNPVRVNKKVTYTATVSPQPNGGTVKFTSHGKTISGCGAVAVNASTGKAKCSTTYHKPGSRRVKATYSGNSSFAHSVSAALTETVKGP